MLSGILAQRIPRQFEVLRCRGLPAHSFSRSRVTERERLRMQRRSGDQRGATAVDGVTEDGMMDIGKVDPDLMGAAGAERHLEQGVASRNGEPPEFRDGLAAAR